MKAFTIVVLMLMLGGCVFHTEEDVLVSCGYEDVPYYVEPYHYDYQLECMTWYVMEYYYECAETWCYDEYVCGWEMYDYTCYPI